MKDPTHAAVQALYAKLTDHEVIALAVYQVMTTAAKHDYTLPAASVAVADMLTQAGFHR